MKKTQEQIQEFLEELEDSDILSIWNDIASYNGAVDSLYDMYLLDEFFGEMKVTEFLNKLDSDFSVNDDYFYDSIWGLASTSDIYDVVDLWELSRILEDDWDTLESWIYCDELIEFMNEEEEEENED